MSHASACDMLQTSWYGHNVAQILKVGSTSVHVTKTFSSCIHSKHTRYIYHGTVEWSTLCGNAQKTYAHVVVCVDGHRILRSYGA
jgi:hypothetical protein